MGSVKHQLSREERRQTACKELSSLITLALVTEGVVISADYIASALLCGVLTAHLRWIC